MNVGIIVFLMNLSVLTPSEADASVRPFLPDLTQCFTKVEPNQPLDLTFDLAEDGRISNLSLVGDGVQLKENCLKIVQSKMHFLNQNHATQYVSFRAVYVNSALELLPNASIRLPETILPGIFATPKTKSKLINALKNQEDK